MAPNDNLNVQILRTAAAFLLLTASACAQYVIDIRLSAAAELAGRSVTVTCDVINKPNTSFTMVWIRRRSRQEVESSAQNDDDVEKAISSEENIGSNGHLEKMFQDSGRYSVKYDIIQKLQHVRFTLTIQDLRAVDSGDIGCRIPIAKIDAFKSFAVLVPIHSIRLVSSNAEGSHTQSYVNGQQVKFVEGEIRHLSCIVNGSHPAADVRMMIDQTDITEQFTKTTQLVRTGPANVTVKQNIYYWTELRQKDMAIGFELSGKAISCVADVPGSDFSQSSTRIYPIFDSYKPKFVNCTGPHVHAKVYQNNLLMSCDVQAMPPVTEFWIKWNRGRSTSTSGHATLDGGQRDGHYLVELRRHNPDSAAMRVVSLNVDKIYPQHFTSYTFVAKNDQGISETDLHLVHGAEIGALRSGGNSKHRAGNSLSTMSTMMMISAVLLLVVTG